MTAQNSIGPRPTRGAALVASVAVVLVLISGCNTSQRQPSSAGSNSGSTQASQSPNPLTSGPAGEALAAITETRLFVQSVGIKFPGLQSRTDRVAATHAVHEDFLQGLLGTTTSPSPEAQDAAPIPARRARAERAIVTTESRLASELAGLADNAEDGALARALASLSAGTAQVATSAGWTTDPAPAATLPEAPALSAPETLAVQEILAREHASLWWYGVLGGRTSATQQPGLIPMLTTGYAAHRRQRDELTGLLFDQGVTPVAAEPTYPIDWNLRSRSQNVKEVHRIEHDSAAAYSWLVAETTADLRTWAITALRNAAIRDLAVQGTPENFPGADELADH